MDLERVVPIVRVHAEEEVQQQDISGQRLISLGCHMLLNDVVRLVVDVLEFWVLQIEVDSQAQDGEADASEEAAGLAVDFSVVSPPLDFAQKLEEDFPVFLGDFLLDGDDEFDRVVVLDQEIFLREFAFLQLQVEVRDNHEVDVHPQFVLEENHHQRHPGGTDFKHESVRQLHQSISELLKEKEVHGFSDGSLLVVLL